ncbi:MAG: VWA domain-containing protein [Eubacterium sp.]|nr:VWA domain-containing protein [Eubacterium sp.]
MENKNNHLKRILLVLISALLLFSSVFSGCSDGEIYTTTADYTKIDTLIQNIVEDESLDKNEQIKKIDEVLQELSKQGVLNDGTLNYDENNELFSFEYSDGSLGGVSLKQFDDELNSHPVKAVSSEDDPSIYTVGDGLNAIVLNGFENTSYRRDYYEKLESDWDSRGLETFVDVSVTVSDLKRLTPFDVVVFAMHGSLYNNNPVLCLNQTVTSDTDKETKDDRKSKYIAKVYYPDDKCYAYWILPAFFNCYYSNDELKTSVIFSETCEFFGDDSISTTPDYTMANTLDKISSGAIIGYHNSVGADYSRNVMKTTIDTALGGGNINDALEKAKDTYGDNDNLEDKSKGKYIAYPIIVGNQNATLVDLPVKDFSIPDNMTLTLGEIDVIEPEIEPVGASDYSIKWTSSNESVATVTPTGEECIVTSKGKGTAIITGELISNGKTITKSTNVRVASQGRDTVLVLDVSGSMSGTPIDEMKKSAINFCNELLTDEYNNRVGLVLYDDSIDTVDLTNDLDSLINYIESISSGGTTNMQGALAAAGNMLDNQGKDDNIKNVVVMADGLPNEGETSDTGKMSQLTQYSSYPSDVAYANGVINTAENIMSNYNMYSLGFFHDLSGVEKDFAVDLMKFLTNMPDGYHQVDTAENLQFAFGDIQETISDGSKVVINIACPVDVSVTYNGETLSSAQSTYSDTASFGTLQLLGKNKDIKVLSLDPSVVYDVQLSGTGSGTMNYSVNYLDDSNAIIDYRTFESIPITPTTKIDSNTNNSAGEISLNIDENGDGTVDKVYSAAVNSVAELTYGAETQEPEVVEKVEPEKSDDTWVTVMIAVVVIIALVGIILTVILVSSSNKKKNQSYNIPVIEPKNDTENKSGKITVISGSMSGKEFDLDTGKGYIIGKDSSKSQIALAYDYSKVSREHCVISYDDQTQLYSVIDMSSNGTYYIDNKTAPLNSSVSKHRLNKSVGVELQSGCILILGDEDCRIVLN